MQMWIPLILIFSVFFVPPFFLPIVTGLIFAFGIFAVFRRGYHVTTPLNKFVWALLALTLVSALVNWTDPISTAMFLGFHLLPLAGFWAVLQFGVTDLSTKRTVRWMGLFTLVQLPVLGYQWYCAGAGGLANISHDLFAGTIARPEISTHTFGIVMMLVMVVSFSLFRAARNGFYLCVALVSFLGWILSATGHSYVAFMIGFFILMVYRHKHRLLRMSVRVLFVVAVVCLAVIYTRDAIFQIIKVEFYQGEVLRSDKFNAYMRTLFFSSSFREIPDWGWAIGVGPGMYTSRVALTKTGTYLRGRTYSFFPFPELSPYTDAALTYHSKSSIGNAPWSSFISLWGEVGPGGVVLILLIFGGVFRMGDQIRKSTADPFFKGISEGLQFCSILYFLIMGVENWLEFPKVATLFWILTALVYCHGRSITVSRIRSAA